MTSFKLCKHCSSEYPHRYVCNCGHEHNDHVFANGCTKCRCERYDQTQQLTAEAWRDKKAEEKKSSAKVENKIKVEELRV